MSTALDVVTIGRSSVDLYGQQIGGRLEDMASFAKSVGGSPTNTAIGASRLGLKAGLITRVGEESSQGPARRPLCRSLHGPFRKHRTQSFSSGARSSRVPPPSTVNGASDFPSRGLNQRAENGPRCPPRSSRTAPPAGR